MSENPKFMLSRRHLIRIGAGAVVSGAVISPALVITERGSAAAQPETNPAQFDAVGDALPNAEVMTEKTLKQLMAESLDRTAAERAAVESVVNNKDIQESLKRLLDGCEKELVAPYSYADLASINDSIGYDGYRFSLAGSSQERLVITINGTDNSTIRISITRTQDVIRMTADNTPSIPGRAVEIPQAPQMPMEFIIPDGVESSYAAQPNPGDMPMPPSESVPPVIDMMPPIAMSRSYTTVAEVLTALKLGIDALADLLNKKSGTTVYDTAKMPLNDVQTAPATPDFGSQQVG